jgi:pyruvate kinase
MGRRTKIVATLGPACDDASGVESILRAGADVVRLNLSHGPIDEHLHRLDLVRGIAAHLGRPVAALVDLPGPKIRSGVFAEGGVDLHPGSPVRLIAGSGPSTAELITVDYADALAEVAIGDRVVLGDGGISLEVLGVDGAGVRASVETGGRVQGRPGVHLPSTRMKMRAPTDDDLANAETVTAAGVDYVALSFVRAASDVAALRAVIGDRAGIVAKIETATALADLDAIVAAADAVMVARGDLGIDVPLEDVPHLQKHIIRTCVELGVPVITATQMLESMVDAPSPTRAEVSDVANAVFDGTDALMLSAETAIGRDHDGADRRARRVRDQLPAVGRTPRSRGAGGTGQRRARRRRLGGEDHRGDHSRGVAGRLRRLGDGDLVLHPEWTDRPGDGPLPAERSSDRALP